MTSYKLGEVIVGASGARYRTGFLAASWGSFDPDDPRRRLQARRENVMALAEEVYHYTSLAGLKGIIEENGFWASDNRFLNDAEELNNGARLASEILQHRAKRTRDQGFRDILAAVGATLSAPRKHGLLVACFSTVRDDLGQWRGYGNGGVCLRLGRPEEDECHVFFGPEHLQFEAIYSNRRKVVALISRIQSFEREYAMDRSVMADCWPDDHDENYTKELQGEISHSILAFKDAAFASEAEIRIVTHYSYEGQYKGGLRFRVTPLGLVPYLRTGDNRGTKGRLPLKEVIVGPSARQELVAESVCTFLHHKGYEKTSVTLSKVPYRSL